MSGADELRRVPISLSRVERRAMARVARVARQGAAEVKAEAMASYFAEDLVERGCVAALESMAKIIDELLYVPPPDDAGEAE